jgi:hypothetical protein
MQPLPADRDVAIQALSEHVYGPLVVAEVEATEHVGDCGTSFKEFALTSQFGMARIGLVTPSGDGPFPTFVGLNFHGNHGTEPQRSILGGIPWDRSSHFAAWPFDQILSAGFAVATCRYEDWFPDDPVLVRDWLKSRDLPRDLRAISAWAAGISAMVSAVQLMDENAPCIAIGHSRLGKAALWASALDSRISACVSIQSGCGGSGPNLALDCEVGAEHIADITGNFPHWFADRYSEWAHREEEMSFDMHWLLATIAPRPVLLLSAREDAWANPAGQERVAAAARPAFPSPRHVRTHVKEGGHQVSAEDWERAIQFSGEFL